MTEGMTKKVKKTLATKLESLAPNEDEPSAHREGALARGIEYQTARLPSDVFLWAAAAAGGLAIYLALTGRRRVAGAVAQLAPTLLTLGVYNKIVKVAGSDRLDQARPLLDGHRRRHAGKEDATLH